MYQERLNHVYIMANKGNTTFYTGVTGNLERRVYEHKNKIVKGFTTKYNINKLVYFESYKYIRDAIQREKQIKSGSRKDKLKLIREENPGFKDLATDWYN
ncbi:MAG: GIY-YIG nuclease family protein [bacterium]